MVRRQKDAQLRVLTLPQTIQKGWGAHRWVQWVHVGGGWVGPKLLDPVDIPVWGVALDMVSSSPREKGEYAKGLRFEHRPGLRHGVLEGGGVQVTVGAVAARRSVVIPACAGGNRKMAQWRNGASSGEEDAQLRVLRLESKNEG